MTGLDLEDMWNFTSPPVSLILLQGEGSQHNTTPLSSRLKLQSKDEDGYFNLSFLPFNSSGVYSNMSEVNTTSAVSYNWGVLSLSTLIIATMIGNILVCLAVCWEKRLQNMTNYFLMSLAIADLLVSVLVMPLGMVVELFGK